ncbi:MAG: autotransporter outer membrane beta-barrel domain-containing protein, partial [Stellaceae bacterium]
LGVSPDIFTNNGTVTGSVLLAGDDDIAILNTGSSISGTLDGGDGTDTLKLGGTGGSTLDLGNVTGFEILDKIDSGGTLAGTGTIIGAVAVNGTVAPGNSIGTLHVTGSYAQGAGSIYAVQLNPSSSDLIAVAGSATVDGTASVHVAAAVGAYTVGQQFTILSATGGVTGQYGGITDNLAFVDFALDADGNDIFLDVTAAATPFDQVARTPNEKAAARGLESLGAGHAPFDAVFGLTVPDAIRAFDLLSGEIHPSVVTVLLNDSGDVRDAILGRLRQSIGGTAAIFAPTLATLDYGRRAPTRLADAGDPPLARQKEMPAPSGLTAWAQPFGGFGHSEGDGNAASLNRATSGVLAGIDATLVSPGVWRVGLAAGYQGSSVDVGDRASSASVGTYHVAAYGGTQQGPLGLRAGAAYSGHSLDTRRAVVFPGFAETERASYGGATMQGFGEAGVALELGRVALEPFAGLAYVDVRTDGFTESGGSAVLHSPGSGADTLYSSLGLRGALALPWYGADGDLIVKGAAAWQHGFGTTVPASSLAFASSSPFVVAGVPIAADEAKVELGLDLKLAANATLGIAYTGQIAGNAQDHQFSANFALRF